MDNVNAKIPRTAAHGLIRNLVEIISGHNNTTWPEDREQILLSSQILVRLIRDYDYESLKSLYEFAIRQIVELSNQIMEQRIQDRIHLQNYPEQPARHLIGDEEILPTILKPLIHRVVNGEKLAAICGATLTFRANTPRTPIENFTAQTGDNYPQRLVKWMLNGGERPTRRSRRGP